MTENTIILGTKYRFAANALKHMRSIMYFHWALGLGFVSLLLAGGTYIFFRIFDFLMDFEDFGGPLMDSLVGIVFLAFFSMLIFSNLIITLSTSYISKEVDFLMVQPIPYAAIFRQKMIESIIYSSWAFVVLSLPFFLAFGLARDVGWHFYPMIAGLIIPFLVIPAVIGSLITMLVTALMPAKKTKTLIIILAVLSIGISIVMARVLGIRQMFTQLESQNFGEVMRFLQFGTSPFMPSSWMMEGVLSIGPANLSGPDFAQYFYWLAMLSSTALVLYQVSEWLVPKLYYKGWCLTRESSNMDDKGQSKFSPFKIFDKILLPLPRQYRILLGKDMRTFWRDPAQWTQLVLLFGLLVIYVTNLRYAARHSNNVELLVTEWKTMLAFFNIGAAGFILSIMTTRFIYPMISLEGRQAWSIGLAPMPRARIVWQKFYLCLAITTTLSFSILLLSNYVLSVEPKLQVIGYLCAFGMSLALSSLSVGLGSLFPNFREDNPARIANGVGGTANALLSLAYIVLAIGMIGVPYHLGVTGALDGSVFWDKWKVPYYGLYAVIQGTAIILPMSLGLMKWKSIQF